MKIIDDVEPRSLTVGAQLLRQCWSSGWERGCIGCVSYRKRFSLGNESGASTCDSQPSLHRTVVNTAIDPRQRLVA